MIMSDIERISGFLPPPHFVRWKPFGFFGSLQDPLRVLDFSLSFTMKCSFQTLGASLFSRPFLLLPFNKVLNDLWSIVLPLRRFDGIALRPDYHIALHDSTTHEGSASFSLLFSFLCPRSHTVPGLEPVYRRPSSLHHLGTVPTRSVGSSAPVNLLVRFSCLSPTPGCPPLIAADWLFPPPEFVGWDSQTQPFVFFLPGF